MERRGLEALMSYYKTLKEEAWAANMEIPKRCLALYTWGNVSSFDPDRGVFAIKPSGVPYSDLKPNQMVVLDLDGTIVEGNLNPSSDTPTHRILYQNFNLNYKGEIRGIIHTHSSNACAWAQACKEIPLFGTTHADHIQVPVPCTPCLSIEAVTKDYELETGKLIIEIFKKNKFDPQKVPMVLVGGHGPFAWGATASQAVYNAAVLEEVAKMAILTLQANPAATQLPSYITQKHYLRKHGPNAYYGQDK